LDELAVRRELQHPWFAGNMALHDVDITLAVDRRFVRLVEQLRTCCLVPLARGAVRAKHEQLSGVLVELAPGMAKEVAYPDVVFVIDIEAMYAREYPLRPKCPQQLAVGSEFHERLGASVQYEQVAVVQHMHVCRRIEARAFRKRKGFTD